MILTNKTRNMIICENIREAKTLKEKTKGLIGSDGKTSLFFKTRFGIHTFGMDVPIDVVILDNKGKVVKIKKNISPNRTFFWNPIYKKIIEMPSERKDGKVRKGDILAISDK